MTHFKADAPSPLKGWEALVKGASFSAENNFNIKLMMILIFWGALHQSLGSNDIETLIWEISIAGKELAMVEKH